MQFAVDDSPPDVSIAEIATSSEHYLTKPLDVTATLHDRESGVMTITIGIDQNGNGLLEENEPQKKKEFTVATGASEFQDSGSWNCQFVPDEFPKQPGKFDVIATGTNARACRRQPGSR